MRGDCIHVKYKWHAIPEMYISLLACTLLPLRNTKVDAWGPLKSENQFCKDYSRGFVVKFLGQLSK